MNNPLKKSDKVHVLVVDDDDRLRLLLERYLKENNLLVSAARDAYEAEKLMGLFVFDLLIVDVMMPGLSGVEFTKDLRKKNNVPVLMLTAMGEVENRIAGLESGADDYLSKPFEPKELLLRIKSILRRVPRLDEAAVLQSAKLKLGSCEYDTDTGELFKNGEKVRLTPAEAALLKVFSDGVGRILSREDVIKKTGDENNPRTIDVQIARLRNKIENDPKVPKYLQTIRGKGYILLTD